MPSPFPGMDPYLEDPIYWPDVHHSLPTYLRDELNAQIAPAYYAHAGERVYISSRPDAIIPDVSVAVIPSRAGRPTPSRAKASGLEPDTPTIVIAPLEEVHEPFLMIMDARRGGKVVTVVEFLSPTNKSYGSEGYRQYREKQQEVVRSDANLVEIDLLRGGAHTVAFPREAFPPPRDWDYLVCVNRAEDRRAFEVYTATVRDRLPRVAIPLASSDPDVVIDIQSLVDRCYDNGGYAYLLDYASEPPTPLRESDREWARGVIASRAQP